MGIFSGLSAQQIDRIRQSRIYRKYAPGQTIFKEGDEAQGLFIVMEGRVEIYRETVTGDYPLNELTPQSVFGEMGLLSDARTRTACARAVEETTLLEVPGNLVEYARRKFDLDSAIALHQNLILILRERLALKDDPSALPVQGLGSKGVDHRKLPGVFLKLMNSFQSNQMRDYFGGTRQLSPGEYLCREGDASDGFFLIHDGKLSIMREIPGRPPREIVELEAPAITGESGFFTKEKRMASIRAKEMTTYTLISEAGFEKLRADSPKSVLGILWATAQFVTYLIIQRENL